MDRLVSDFLIFVATIDPVGTLALFVGLTAGLAPAQRTKVAFRAIAYSAAILVAFVGVGQVLLGSLGIRMEAFQLAGGIIFFLFGVQMVFGVGAGAASEPGPRAPPPNRGTTSRSFPWRCPPLRARVRSWRRWCSRTTASFPWSTRQ